MTKLLDRLKPPTPDDLVKRRSAAEAALAEAEREYQSAALSVEMDEDGAKDRLAAATDAVRKAKDRVKSIAAAQVGLETVEEERRRREAAAARLKRVAEFAAACEARQKSAAAIAKAIESYVASYRELIAATAAAHAAYPGDTGGLPVASPTGPYSGPGIEKWVRSEIDRNWSNPKLAERRAPGASTKSVYDPATIQPIETMVRDADAFSLTQLRRNTATERTYENE